MSNYVLLLVSGVPRMTLITSTLPPIYDQTVTIVISGGDGTDTVDGPISASTPLTLPASGTYTVVSGVTSLNIYLNGQKLEYSNDWNTSGSGPNYTDFVMTQDLVVDDVLELLEERDT